jgi:hypothetical protein
MALTLSRQMYFLHTQALQRSQSWDILSTVPTTQVHVTYGATPQPTLQKQSHIHFGSLRCIAQWLRRLIARISPPLFLQLGSLWQQGHVPMRAGCHTFDIQLMLLLHFCHTRCSFNAYIPEGAPNVPSWQGSCYQQWPGTFMSQ